MLKFRKWVAANTHATDPLSNGQADALYAGGAGNVVCKNDENAADVTIPVVAGGYVYGRFTHVRLTGTTATGLFALYL